MAHLPDLIEDLALVLGTAAIVILIFKKLNQPLVLGYILAGFFVGPNFKLVPTIIDFESIETWAEIGMIFLLFSLGLEFSFKKLVKVGGASSITAIFEIVTMFAIGYFTGQMFGWSLMNCIFLGGILSISSTTIIIRAFEELGLKNRKFASLVFGVLIIEDLVAILMLVLLSTLAISQQFEGGAIINSVFRLAFFLALWFAGGIFIIPSFLRAIKKLINDEMLLIISLGLCLAMVFLAIEAGFSAALGAFIMGSILAETTYAEKIEHLVKPVKDLFGAVFFISVGMLIDPSMLQLYAVPIIIITIITILGKSLATLIGAMISGQTLKHSLQGGLSLSQIGEFSFIIATLGLTYKVTGEFLYPVAVAVSAITTFTTPNLIKLADPLYNFIERHLSPETINRLNSYSISSHKIKAENEWKRILKKVFSIIVLNSVIIIAVLIISIKFILPYIDEKIESHLGGVLITAVISLVLIAPFLWGLAGKRINYNDYGALISEGNISRGPMIAIEVFRITLAVIFVTYLFFKLFTEGTEFLIAVPVILIIAYIFSERLKRLYNKLEEKFIENLNARESEVSGNRKSEHLPWDAHMAEFTINPESSLAGKTLHELQLREKFGINIASIERGSIRLNLPRKEERIFPGDVIDVIGTDEQLEKLKAMLNNSILKSEDVPSEEITLHHFRITDESKLKGKTIQDAAIHNRYKGLIIGIERNGSRILNPESSMTFEKGDLVWIAGKDDIISKIE